MSTAFCADFSFAVRLLRVFARCTGAKGKKAEILRPKKRSVHLQTFFAARPSAGKQMQKRPVRRQFPSAEDTPPCGSFATSDRP
jgi:hypothetical protein